MVTGHHTTYLLYSNQVTSKTEPSLPFQLVCIPLIVESDSTQLYHQKVAFIGARFPLPSTEQFEHYIRLIS